MEQCKRMIVKMLTITIKDELQTLEKLQQKEKDVAKLIEFANLENQLINQITKLKEL